MFKKRCFLCLFCCFISFQSFAKNTLLIGDSLMGTISSSYKKINKNDNIDIKYIIGSGLENKKFNWFNYIENQKLNQYDSIMISIGTNDFDIKNNKNYSEKVNKFLQSIKHNNPYINIYWIGPPSIKNENINNGVDIVREIIMINAYNKSVKFIDVRKILGYEFLLFKDQKKIRADDGIHYTPLAGDLIVKELNRVIKEK